MWTTGPHECWKTRMYLCEPFRRCLHLVSHTYPAREVFFRENWNLWMKFDPVKDLFNEALAQSTPSAGPKMGIWGVWFWGTDGNDRGYCMGSIRGLYGPHQWPILSLPCVTSSWGQHLLNVLAGTCHVDPSRSSIISYDNTSSFYMYLRIKWCWQYKHLFTIL